MEGGVYKATWSKIGRDYKIQLITHPNISATESSLQTAEEFILDQITEVLGDGEAVLEYSPRLPLSELENKFIGPDIVRLVGNGDAEGPLNKLSHNRIEYLKEIETYFHGGVCSRCRSPLGPRNSKPIPMDLLNGDGCFTTLGNYFCNLFSEEFIDSSGIHNNNLNFLKVERKKGRKVYYELIGNIEYEYVGVNELIPKGWRCSDCKNVSILYEIPDQLWINYFILYNNTKHKSGFFVAGNKHITDLCITRELWEKRDKRVRAKQIIAEQIGILKKESQIDKFPKLRDY